jgi:hypothetical protein
MIRYTKDHLGQKLVNVINDHTKKIRNIRADVDLYGAPIPQYAADPTVPTALNGKIFIYYNTTSHVFRKYVAGSWSNAGI